MVRRVVEDTVAGREEGVRVTESYFDPNRIVALAAGLWFILLGALVLIDTGIADFPSQPTTSVFGFTQTPLLGVINIGAGLLLLLGAADWDRSISVFTGSLVLMGGIILLVAGDRLPDSLQANDAYGWMAVIVGGVVLIVALAFSSIRSRHVVRSDRVVRDCNPELSRSGAGPPVDWGPAPASRVEPDPWSGDRGRWSRQRTMMGG